jgi:hypothetical protein
LFRKQQQRFTQTLHKKKLTEREARCQKPSNSASINCKENGPMICFLEDEKKEK